MSVITIQCCVVASEATRDYLWKIMVQKNTPLINELLKQVGKQDEFEQWLKKGKLPSGIVRPLCNSLVTQKCFAGQPKRFYKSAIEVTEYIYKSWLALQKNLQRRLDGKTYWLSMLKSYKKLTESNGYSLEDIKNKALEILAKYTIQPSGQQIQERNGKKGSSPKIYSKKLSTQLFEAYNKTEGELERCAIVYLLKNKCEIPEKEEEAQAEAQAEEFADYCRKKENEIERLRVQIASRMPQGRDLTDEFLQTLYITTNNIPENEEQARLWENLILKELSSIPFPIQFTSNEDLTWSKNQKGRICFKLNGLSEHIFEIYCDRRQLHWFKRFLEDQQIKRSDKNNYSSSLFTLRSSRLAWQKPPRKAKGEPWNLHRLILYCSIDTRLWTDEGTQQFVQNKAVEVEKKIKRMQEKEELSRTQQNYVKRLESTLAKLKNPYPRPSKPLYKPKTSILVGVCLGLAKPVTVAVVDASTQKVLAYRSVRQLLGKNYKLLSRQRIKQQINAHKRHKAQKCSQSNQPSESELGKYLDNLLAKAIFSLAQTYQAGSIAIPNMKNMRENLESEIQTLAEKKCPNFKEGQQKYAKKFRQNIHRWSYRRLIECIHTQAAKLQIVVEEVFQPVRGNNQEKARDLAFIAYHYRQNKF